MTGPDSLAQDHSRIPGFIANLSFHRALLHTLVLFILGTLCLWSRNDAAAAAPRRKVLIVYSWHDLMPWQVGVRAGLQERLQQEPEASRPEIYEERIDAGRIKEATSDTTLNTYLRGKYDSVALDAVIAEGQSAATFLLRYPDLFSQTKRFAVNVAQPGNLPSEQTFVVKENPGRALLTIPQVMPDRERIFAVVDHSDYGQRIKAELAFAATSLPPTIRLEILDNYSFDELDAKVKSLPPRSAILYFPVMYDRNRVSQIPRHVVQRLSGLTHAPIFAHHDSFLGAGIVGGYLLSARLEGGLIARIAMGLPLPSSAMEVDAALKSYKFDDIQLQRWAISDAHLPTPNVIINRVASVWVTYRWQIFGALAAIVLEAMLIAALLHFLRQSKQMTRLLADERDQLEQRVTERTAHLSEAKDFNQTIVLNSPLSMGVYDASGQCIEANDAYAQMTGTTRSALLAQNFHNIVAWQKSGLLEACQTALAQQQPQQREVDVVASFGKELWLECRILPTLINARPHLLIQFVDLTERKRFEDELRYFAFHDALTGLPNRRLLLERLQQAVRTRKRHNSHIAVLFLDLNKFKQLNDAHGHDVGDQLLIEVAHRLRQTVRDSDTVARLGGDEFVVLLEYLGPSPEQAATYSAAVADKILQALSAEYVFGEVHHHGSASIGVKLVVGGDLDADQILKDADTAMYEVKRALEWSISAY